MRNIEPCAPADLSPFLAGQKGQGKKSYFYQPTDSGLPETFR